MAESYLKKKRRVLEMIADISRMSRFVVYEDLAKRLEMTDSELAPLCNGLDEDGSIDFPGGDIIQMKDAGYRALEPPVPPTPAISYTLHVQNNYGSIQQGQSNSIINQSLSEVLPKLGAFIESVKAADFERHDKVIEELEEIKSLTQGELNPGIWELIQAKFVSAETAMKIAGVAYGSHPYWSAISDFFHQVWK